VKWAVCIITTNAAPPNTHPMRRHRIDCLQKNRRLRVVVRRRPDLCATRHFDESSKEAPAHMLLPSSRTFGFFVGTIRMRFLRHDGIYRSDAVPNKTEPWRGTMPPPTDRPRARVKERVGKTARFSSSAMSSGRLFLDRVGRHQSPSPLHRHDQHNSIAQSEGTNYHRTRHSWIIDWGAAARVIVRPRYDEKKPCIFGLCPFLPSR